MFLCVIAALLALGLRVVFPHPHYPLWRVVIEAVVLIALVQVFARIAPLRSALAGSTAGTRWVLWVILFFMLLGHLGKFSRITFPFAAWDMYDISPNTHTIYRFYGQDPERGDVELSPPELFPSLGSFRLSSKASELVARALAPPEILPEHIDPHEVRRQVEALTTALAAGYAHRYDVALTNIHVDRCELDRDDPTRMECTTVYRWTP